MVKMSKPLFVKIIDCVACVVILAAGIFFVRNYNYYFVPDPDIFGYINDGKQYISLHLPQNIQVPPVNAVLIALLTGVFKSQEHPEIFSAHGINITAAVATLLLLYLFLRKYSPLVGLTVLFLVCTNPTFIFQGLDVNTEVLFCTVTTLTFLLYQRGYKKAAFLCAGGSFLVRYEGVLLLLAVTVADYLKQPKKATTLRAAVYGLVPVIIWLIIINFQNHKGNLFGNEFIQEAITYRGRVPRFDLITRLPFLLADYFWDTTKGLLYIIGSSLLYLSIGAGALLVILSGNAPLIALCLFMMAYFFFHFFFPFSPDRYIYPLLWGLYALPALGYWAYGSRGIRKIRPLVVAGILLGCFSVYLVAGNAAKVRYYYRHDTLSNTAFPRYVRYEALLTAEWLNKTDFSKPVVVITVEPWIMKYFTHNTNVSFLFAPYSQFQRCETVTCIIAGQGLSGRDDAILLVRQSSSLLADDSFPAATNFNATLFNDLAVREEHNEFILIKSLVHNDVWSEVYQYRPAPHQ
jgi:hypothetical protein